MDRGDPRQALIIRVQGGCHRRKARHEAIHQWLARVSVLEQPLDLVSLANNKTPGAPLDQRCMPEQQAMSVQASPRLSAEYSLRRQN